MDDVDPNYPSAAELAAVEAELPEWERLRVRDYWDAVCVEEWGARSPHAEPEAPTRESTPDSAEVRTLFPTSPENGEAVVEDSDAA